MKRSRPLSLHGRGWLVAAGLFGAAAGPAGADFFARTCHVGPTGGAVLKLTDHNPRGGGQPCTGFEVKVGGKRTSKGRLTFPGSGVFLSTSDGRTVIFVQSYPYISDRGALAGTPGVVFFRPTPGCSRDPSIPFAWPGPPAASASSVGSVAARREMEA